MEHIENFKPSMAVQPICWKHQGDNYPDFESAILLRSLVLPAFENATSWGELAEALESIGFGVSIKNGHLTLVDVDQGVSICTGRFLGKPLVEMAGQLGKPVIRASIYGEACGEFVF